MSSREDLNLAALIRAAADGELPDEQQARLDAHLASHPEDASRIEFERQLRSATGRVMSGVSAPDGLRARIEQIGNEAMAVQTREPSFWSRSSWLGLAASVLVVGGVLTALMAPMSPVGPDARYRASLISFLDREHVRCWIDSDVILDKFDVRESDMLPAEAESLFGRAVVQDDFGDFDGLEYVGGGQCDVPGRAPSLHLGFKTDGSRGEAGVAVSLFVQADNGRLEMAEGVTYRLTSGRRASGVCTIYAWTHDGLIHFMVSDDAGACDFGRAALGAPETVQQL